MRSPPKSDLAFIETVKAHLRQIEAVAFHSVDEASLRAVAGSLRLLIADGALIRAWKAAGFGGPMTFTPWCIDRVGKGEVVAFCGGGDLLPGVPFSACRNASLRQKTLDFAAFCREARVQVGSVKVTTAELIQYVANALGGNHYDPAGKAARKPKAALLRRIEEGEIEAPPLRVNDRSLLHHELLSIAQVVVRSAEVQSLRAWMPAT